jgi:hypothetical protein
MWGAADFRKSDVFEGEEKDGDGKSEPSPRSLSALEGIDTVTKYLVKCDVDNSDCPQ